MAQLQRAAYDMTRLQTPQAAALDRLTDKLLGRSSAACYDVTCTATLESVSAASGQYCKIRLSCSGGFAEQSVGSLVAGTHSCAG